MPSKIVSTGSYLPDHVIENSALTSFPPNSLPLIEQKTGVKTRHHADPKDCTSDLAVRAARRCLDATKFSPSRLDAIILATSSPDRIQPATAARVHASLQPGNAYAFDVNSVCSGGLFALHLADALITAGSANNILVLAAEIYSRYLDPKDFSTYPYFGDGAGAILLSSSGSGPQVISTILCTDGAGNDLIQIPGGGTMLPYRAMSNPREAFFRMSGKEVYQFATTRGPEIITRLLNAAGVAKDRVAAFLLHQANVNIIKAIALTLDEPLQRFPINLDRYGNTAAASVFILLDEYMRDSSTSRSGEYIVIAAFGGGLSWGATLIRL